MQATQDAEIDELIAVIDGIDSLPSLESPSPHQRKRSFTTGFQSMSGPFFDRRKLRLLGSAPISARHPELR
jgi:hypothetical protein